MAHVRRGGRVLGILRLSNVGAHVADPLGSNRRQRHRIGLLDVDTVMAEESDGPCRPFAQSGQVFSGYEIHGGRHWLTAPAPLPVSMAGQW